MKVETDIITSVASESSRMSCDTGDNVHFLYMEFFKTEIAFIGNVINFSTSHCHWLITFKAGKRVPFHTKFNMNKTSVTNLY